MNDLLFEIPESLSPKRAWQKLHGIQTLEGDRNADEERVWAAFLHPDDIPAGRHCEGATENEALYALAMRLKIKTWLEL